jgi:hypothetical protein
MICWTIQPQTKCCICVAHSSVSLSWNCDTCVLVFIGIIFWSSGNFFKHLAKSMAAQAASVSLSVLTYPDPWGKMKYSTIILSSLAETYCKWVMSKMKHCTIMRHIEGNIWHNINWRWTTLHRFLMWQINFFFISYYAYARNLTHYLPPIQVMSCPFLLAPKQSNVPGNEQECVP